MKILETFCLILSLTFLVPLTSCPPAKKEAPPLVVTAPAPKAQTILEKIDDEACILIKQLINLEDKSLTWKDFCNQIAKIYDQDAKFKELAQTFRSLSSSTSTYYIGYQLSWYKSVLPPKTYNLLYQYTSKELSHFIAERIKLNPRT